MSNFMDEQYVGYEDENELLRRETASLMAVGKVWAEFGEYFKYLAYHVFAISQGRLSRASEEYYSELVEQGWLDEGDFIGSLKQAVISNIMAGKQRPTWHQVLIFIRVLKLWAMNPDVIAVFKTHKRKIPMFTPEMEARLWLLAGFQSPEEIFQEYSISRGEQRVIESLVDHREVRWSRARGASSTATSREPHTEPLEIAPKITQLKHRELSNH